jgi:spore coat polysaccharide biosynthesis protein SpsF
MAKVGLIVQARMGSTRLPGKSLMPLAGVPLVGRILERLKRVRLIDDLILAVPSSDTDLSCLGKQYQVNVFEGSENNLLDRYYQAARTHRLDTVLRIPADNVASEPEEIDKIIELYKNNSFDFCSNLSQVFDNGYPDGIGAEIFSFQMLEQAWKKENDPGKREHVHLNFFNYQTQKPVHGVRVGTVQCPQKFARPDVVLDVNTQEQYLKMAKMYDDLYPQNSKFSIIDIIQWWDKN